MPAATDNRKESFSTEKGSTLATVSRAIRGAARASFEAVAVDCRDDDLASLAAGAGSREYDWVSVEDDDGKLEEPV
jgi:hypothetical protein